jgi:hypothetical protein
VVDRRPAELTRATPFIGAWQGVDANGCRFKLAIAPNHNIFIMKYGEKHAPEYAAVGRGRPVGEAVDAALTATLTVHHVGKPNATRQMMDVRFEYQPASDALWDGRIDWRRSS